MPQSSGRSTPVVAILNTSPDTIDLLKDVLEHAGMLAVWGYTHDIRSGKLDLERFMRVHEPDVILYDIAPPYDRNWQFLQHLRSMPPITGRQFVLMTTNVERVREQVGTAEHVYEIVGKPFDLDQIVKAVKEASRARATR